MIEEARSLHEKESEEYYNSIVSDIFEMMTYARETGKLIPESLSQDISRLISDNSHSEKIENVYSKTVSHRFDSDVVVGREDDNDILR